MYKKLLLWAFFTFVLRPAFTQPVIHSFTPLSAAIGAAVVITGENFDPILENNIVYFGAVKAMVTAAASTTLTVSVPAGATYAPITVTTGGLTAYSRRSFIVTFNGGGRVGPESFKARTDISTTNVIAAALADVDGDGLCDVIASDGSLVVYRNISSSGTFSFQSNAKYAVRPGPTGIGTGDLDGDGRLDIAVTAYAPGSSGVSVFKNTSTTGSVSLGPRIDYSSGRTGPNSYSENVAIGDLDGDGKPDMAVRNADRTMSVFRNTTGAMSNISLGFKQDFSIGSGTGNISISDLDSDGKQDIMVANGDNTINLFRNISTKGNISFESTSFITGQTPVYACVGDLDNDGKNELVIPLANSNRIAIYKNNSTIGNISFVVPSINYQVNDIPVSAAVSDVDGDGRPDIIVAASLSKQVYVFRHSNNDTALLFDAPAVYMGNYGTYMVNVGDVDTDGTPDILSCGMGGQLAVFRNVIRYPHIFDFSPVAGAAGTVVTIRGYNFLNCSAVHVGLTSARTFTVLSDSVIQATVGAGTAGVVSVTGMYGTDSGAVFSVLSPPVISSLSPLYGDTGTVVTLYGSNFDTIAEKNIVYLGDVKGTVLFATPDTLKVQVPPGAASKPLTVTANGLTGSSAYPFTVTFKGAPQAILPSSFSQQKNISSGEGVGRIYTSDIDGDGKTDILACNGFSGNSISILPNRSTKWDINFPSRVDISMKYTPACLAASDISGDGMPDLIIGSEQSKVISVLKNMGVPGTPGFAPAINFEAGAVGDLTVGDIDGDGLQDIVSTDYQASGSFSVMQNISAGDSIAFSSPLSFTAGSNPRGIALRDLNHDNKPDVILANVGDDNIYLYINASVMGLVAFETPLIYNTADYPYNTPFVGDLNKDSLLDLATWNYWHENFSVLKRDTGTNNINFDPYKTINTPVREGDLMPGDLNGDGMPDLVTNYMGTVFAMKNESTNDKIYYAPGNSYGMISRWIEGIAMSDLDNDGKNEIIVAHNNGITLSIFRNRINEPVIFSSAHFYSRVFIDSVVLVHNGCAYVQRHYDIESENSSDTTAVSVKLYFTQQEFDRYNAFPGHIGDLPRYSNDSVNKANLRIVQYHGISASGLPDTYDGSRVEINPDNNNIIWNEAAQWWEVTVTVKGFSGFFATGVNDSAIPLTLVSFTARREGNKAIIEWEASQEAGVSHYILQRSTDSQVFYSITQKIAEGLSTSAFYRYVDDLGDDTLYFYRLLIVNKDGSIVNSKLVKIRLPYENENITLFPNPAADVVWVRHPAITPGAQLILIDMHGRIVKKVLPATGATKTPVSVKGLLNGSYVVVYRNRGWSLTRLLFVR